MATVRLPRTAVNVWVPAATAKRGDAFDGASLTAFGFASTRIVTVPDATALSARTRALAA